MQVRTLVGVVNEFFKKGDAPRKQYIQYDHQVTIEPLLRACPINPLPAV
jgi:hypothetical protein